MPPAMGPEHFLAGKQALHRPPRLHRELRDYELKAERVGLAAERAADERLDHPHPRFGKLQNPGQLAMYVMRNLGRRPNRQIAVRLVVSNRSVRLARLLRRSLVDKN